MHELKVWLFVHVVAGPRAFSKSWAIIYLLPNKRGILDRPDH